jgi:hypothetical protein
MTASGGTVSLTVAELQLMQEKLLIHEQMIEGLKDKLNIKQMASLFDANFYSYFPKALLLKDEVHSLHKHLESHHLRLNELESSQRSLAESCASSKRDLVDLDRRVAGLTA